MARIGGSPHLRRSLLLVLATLSLAAPSMGADAETSNDAPVRVLDDATDKVRGTGAIVASRSGSSLEVSAPGLRVEDVLRERIDPTDVRTQMDAVRLAIELDTHVQLPDLRPAHTRDGDDPFHVLPPEGASETFDEPPPLEPEPEPSGTLSYPSPAGDLTGDGLDDLLVYEVQLPQESVQIRALRGTNGAELWTMTMSDVAEAVSAPTSDLTGDGVGDFLLIALQVDSETLEEDCDEESFTYCRVDYVAGYTWLSGVLSGADGEVAWSRTAPGSLSYHFLLDDQRDVAAGEFRYEERLLSSNVTVLPAVSGDHDADRLDDVLLQSIDLRYDIEERSERTVIVYQNTGRFDVESETRAELLRGRDGRVLLSRSSAPSPMIVELSSGGDLVGDPTPDFVWEEVSYTPETYDCLRVEVVEQCEDAREFSVGFAMEAIDGETLETAWRLPIEGADVAYIRPLEADLSADGRDEITILTYRDGEPPTFMLRMHSGLDGALQWQRQETAEGDWFELPVAVDAYGGAAGRDLLTASFLADDAPGDIRLSRVDGLSGQTLFETKPRIHEPLSSDYDLVFTYTYVYSPHGDADGDRVGDILAGGIRAGFGCPDEGGFCDLQEVRSSDMAESGRNGAVFHRRSGVGELFVIEPTPDLDGDARADAFEWEFPLEEGGADEVMAQRLGPTEELWRRTLSEGDSWDETLRLGGDHDGAPGEEILYARNEMIGDRWGSIVASLGGSNGMERWRREG